MGLFGGGNSRSSNTTNNDIKNYNLQGVTAQSVVAGSNNTMTDHGAVAAAINSNQAVSLASIDHVVNMATQATASVANVSNNANEMIERESVANADRVQEMAKAVATNGQNLMSQNNNKVLLIVGGISVAAVGAVAVMAKGK